MRGSFEEGPHSQRAAPRPTRPIIPVVTTNFRGPSHNGRMMPLANAQLALWLPWVRPRLFPFNTPAAVGSAPLLDNGVGSVGCARAGSGSISLSCASAVHSSCGRDVKLCAVLSCAVLSTVALRDAGQYGPLLLAVVPLAQCFNSSKANAAAWLSMHWAVICPSSETFHSVHGTDSSEPRLAAGVEPSIEPSIESPIDSAVAPASGWLAGWIC